MIKLLFKLLLYFFPKMKSEFFSVKIINDDNTKSKCYYKISKKTHIYECMMTEIKLSEELFKRLNSIFLFKGFYGPAIDLMTCKLIGFYLDSDAFDMHKSWLRNTDVPNLKIINWDKVYRECLVYEYRYTEYPGVYSFKNILFDSTLFYAPEKCFCNLIHVDKNNIIIEVDTDISLDSLCVLSRVEKGVEVIDNKEAYKYLSL